MSKENVGFTPPPYSTRHGVAQISQNFRVTKPFGDRKRPRDANYSEHQFSSDYHFGVETEPSSSVNFVNERALWTDLSNGVETERIAGVRLKIESASDPFRTPVKRTECSNFSDGFTGPSLLDDDFFDESVLQEIDAIVEQQSMKKQGRPKHDIDIDADSKENDNGDGKGNYFSTSGPLIVGDKLREGGALDCLKYLKSKEEDTETSSIMPTGSMPADEY